VHELRTQLEHRPAHGQEDLALQPPGIDFRAHGPDVLGCGQHHGRDPDDPCAVLQSGGDKIGRRHVIAQIDDPPPCGAQKHGDHLAAQGVVIVLHVAKNDRPLDVQQQIPVSLGGGNQKILGDLSGHIALRQGQILPVPGLACPLKHGFEHIAHRRLEPVLSCMFHQHGDGAFTFRLKHQCIQALSARIQVRGHIVRHVRSPLVMAVISSLRLSILYLTWQRAERHFRACHTLFEGQKAYAERSCC